MLFFSYFEDKYVESKDSWKTENKTKQPKQKRLKKKKTPPKKPPEHWLLQKWKFQPAPELAYIVV